MLLESAGRCAVMQAEGGEFYFLAGDMKGLKQGDRALVRGRLADASVCGAADKETTILVSDARKPFGSG